MKNWHWLLLAGLLVGCSKTPAAPATSFMLDRHVASAETPARFAAPVDATPRSGAWRFTWQLGEQLIERELELTFLPDGTVEHPAMSVEAEAGDDVWGGGAVEFGGECGPQLPDGRLGFGCDRYRMRLLSAREMTGVVSIRVNFRWVEVEATGRWVPEAKWPSAEPRS